MDDERNNQMAIVQGRMQKEFKQFNNFCTVSQSRFNKNQEGEATFLFQLLEQRLFKHTPLLKGFFARKVYDYLHHTDIDDEINVLYAQVLPFCLETSMTVQYYHNQILDRKGGIITPVSINNNLILSNLLEHSLQDYVEEKLPRSTSTIVNHHLRVIQKVVDLGQLIEKQNNLYTNYRDQVYGIEQHPWLGYVDHTVIQEVQAIIVGVAPELEGSKFLEWYLQRIFLTGAFIYPETVRMIAELSGGNPRSIQNLEHFAGLYGMMVQIVNDLCDLVPSTFNANSPTKGQTDAYSDLKTKNITLPLLLHLKNQADGYVKQHLESRANILTPSNEWKALKELFNSKSIAKTRESIVQLRKRSVSLLDKDKGNPNYSLFVNMCDFAYSNTFEHFYRRLRRQKPNFLS